MFIAAQKNFPVLEILTAKILKIDNWKEVKYGMICGGEKRA
jgi:hypothetical protein